MLIKELEDFEAQDRHLYTVEDVLVAKYSENSKEVSACRGHIYEIMQTPIAELTSESLLRYGKRLLATPIYRGGGVTSEGVRRGERKLPEPVTVLRKFAYLSSAINHAVKAGAKLENPCKMVITYIREMDKKTS